MKYGFTACLLSFLLFAAGLSVAQNYPKIEVPVGFSLVNVHPAVDQISSFNIYGGGGGLVYNLTPFIGIKADLMGYTQSSKQLFRIEPHFSGYVSGNLFTYLFGVQLKKHSGKFQPFGEALFGGAHTNLYTSFRNLGFGSGSNNGFSMEYGLGLDIPLAKSIQIRPVEVDYLYTHFGSRYYPSTSRSQNNFKYFAGVNFTLAGK